MNLGVNRKEHVSLAVRLMGRELQSQRGRLVFYAACLSLGVAAIAAVSGFSSQVQETVRRNSRLLLGGDVEIQDVRALPAGLVTFAQGSKETRGAVLVDEIVAMARPGAKETQRNKEARLVSVHAVSGDFPLAKGSLVTDPPDAFGDVGNLRGGAVVDAGLARAWKLGAGDSIVVSGKAFRIEALLVDELSRDFSSLALGPRIYVHRDDAVSANLIGSTSRFRERLLLSVTPGANLDALVESLQQEAARLGLRSPRISHHEKNAGTSTRPLRNLSFFLAQVALSTLVLTGLGAASGLGEYLRTRLPDVAIYRALGARPALPTVVLLGVVCAVAGSGVAAGLALGEALRLFVLVPLVGGMLPMDLADVVGTGAALDVAAATFGTLVLLCVPVLLTLQRTSPADVLRGQRTVDAGGRSGKLLVVLTALAATAILAALFVRHAPNPRAGLLLFGATVALFVLFRAFARGLVGVFGKFETRLPPALRLSLAEIASRKETAVLSMALAGLSLFLTCLVQFVKDDLLTPLGNTSAAGKPNLYLVDVQPTQKAGIEQTLLSRNKGAPVYASPMIRARLTTVNGEEMEGRVDLPPQGLGEADPEDDVRRAREREQNLTYRYSLSDGEKIVERLDSASTGTPGVASGQEVPAGLIWAESDGPRAEVSIEKEFAKRARVALGDTLSFDVQGIRIEARVTSLRSVNWQNWRPNFFLIAHPSLLEGAPQMNLVATHVETAEARADIQGALAESFPNVSVLDAAAIVRRVSELSSGIAEATRFLAGLLLGASLLVLAAGLVATRGSRMRHYAIVRSLGGRDGLLSKSLALEFLWLGGASGFAGIVTAAVLSRVFAQTFLEVEAGLSLVPAVTLFVSYLVVNVVVGWLSCASVLRRKPAEILRES